MKALAPFILIILSLSLCDDLFGQNIELQPVPTWGLYLDLTDPDARAAAADISKAGFSRYFDKRDSSNYIVLNTGDISFITNVLKKKRSDGIIVRTSNTTAEICGEKTAVRDSIIEFKAIKNNFYNQFYLQLQDNTPERYILSDGNIENKYYKSQGKKFKMYFKNKIRSNPFKNYYWLPLGHEAADFQDEDYSYVFYNKKKELVTLRFDTLPGVNAKKLDAFEDENCSPIDRLTIFKELNVVMPAAGYAQRYRPRSNFVFGKNFTVNFEKNSSDYLKSDINQIVDFVKDNSYSIISAEVHGYASVEGTIENNKKLMKKRADVLIGVLEKYNDEKIDLDSLIVSENWEKFNSQIKGTEFEWLLDLTQDSVKSLLEYDSLNEKLEPFLAEQRKAIMNLKLSQKLDKEEKIDMVFTNYMQYSSFLRYPERNTLNLDYRPVLFGVIDYLENMVNEDLLDSADVLNRLPAGPLFFDLYLEKSLNDYYSGKKEGNLLSMEDILIRANDLYISLYSDANLSRKHKINGIEISPILLKKLAYIQLTAIDMVEKDRVSKEFLCDLKYPEDNPRFYPLILNLLKYYDENNYNYLSCQQEFESSIKPNSDFISNPKNRYYFLIKKIVLEGDTEILSNVYRLGQLMEFDLYWFLQTNIENWDVANSQYYDEDVDMVVMRSQLRRLERMRDRLCPWLVDQLFIDYNLKVLHKYLKEGIKSKDDEAVISTSFGYLKRYFMSRAAILDEATVLKIAYQFILLNNLYLTRDGSEAAYDLLNAVNRKNALSGESAILFLRLAYYHNNSFLSLLNNNPPLDYCQLFKGRYSVYPYGKIKDKICESCED